jgi:hypothetical protein
MFADPGLELVMCEGIALAPHVETLETFSFKGMESGER